MADFRTRSIANLEPLPLVRYKISYFSIWVRFIRIVSNESLLDLDMRSFLGGAIYRLSGVITILFVSITGLLYFFRDSVPVIKNLDVLKTGSGDRLSSYFETALQDDPPLAGPPFGVVVIAAQSTTDLSWTAFPKAKCVM